MRSPNRPSKREPWLRIIIEGRATADDEGCTKPSQGIGEENPNSRRCCSQSKGSGLKTNCLDVRLAGWAPSMIAAWMRDADEVIVAARNGEDILPLLRPQTVVRPLLNDWPDILAERLRHTPVSITSWAAEVGLAPAQVTAAVSKRPLVLRRRATGLKTRCCVPCVSSRRPPSRSPRLPRFAASPTRRISAGPLRSHPLTRRENGASNRFKNATHHLGMNQVLHDLRAW